MSAEPSIPAPLPSVVQPPTIQFHAPDAPTPADLASQVCPNCGSTQAKRLVLTVDVQLPDNPAKRLRVLHCPDCTAHFYDSQVPPDYAEPALNNRGRVPFYVQQGAGVSLITRPLARVRLPAGSHYMEVGCGYGFGLDFAVNTKGWHGVGIDPAPLAALGRDALGLPIELRYLREDDEARGTMDVVMGSEVIEHVTSPKAFVRTLRAMLRPGGVLILTTPNGNDIQPETPPGIIIPLLSPSLHLVIQNPHSLRTLLEQGGFGHVQVEIDSHSLVAFASDAPLDLEDDPAVLRQALRTHLEKRAGAVDRGSDLFIAYAGRAFTESVNDGAMDVADRAWAMLVPACQARYGFGLDAMTALPEGVATCGLEEMARLMPLNLGGLLHGGAIRRLAAGTPRPALEGMFLLAAQAAAVMRRALGELAMEDGQTEDIGWTAEAEALLCAAAANSADLVARLAALAPAPNGGAARRQSIVRRAVAILVNDGQYATARGLVAEAGAAPAADAVLNEADRDWLFTLAMLDVALGPDGRPLGDVAAGRARLQRVRAASPAGAPLWWATVNGEAQALRAVDDTEGLVAFAADIVQAHESPQTLRWAIPLLADAGQPGRARALAGRLGAAARMPDGVLSPEDRAWQLTLAMVDLAPDADGRPAGDVTAARERLRRVRAACPAGDALWWAAVNGEAQALRALGDTDGLVAFAGQIAQAHAAPEVLRWAVPLLVNAGQYEKARVVAAQAGTSAAPDGVLTEAERDWQFTLAMLDVALGPDGRPLGDVAAGRARLQRVQASCLPGEPLWWAAVNGEAQALRALGDTDGLVAFALGIVQAHDAPDSLRWAIPLLVNAGQDEVARGLAARLDDGARALPEGALDAAARDWQFALAMLDVALGADGRPLGDVAAGRARLQRVRAACPAGGPLWWAAVHGEAQALRALGDTDGLVAFAGQIVQADESPQTLRWAIPLLVNAGQYGPAQALAGRLGPAGTALAPGDAVLDAAERDWQFTLAMLDVALGADGAPLGNLVAGRARLRRVRAACPAGSALWWATVHGEVQALQALGDTDGLAALAEEAVRDDGTPQTLRWAFPMLVNTGQYEKAAALAKRGGLEEAAFTQPGSTQAITAEERDIMFCLAILDLQSEGGPSPAMARGRFARVRSVSEPGSGLWVAAIRGELQALHMMEAEDDAEALLDGLIAAHPGVALPPDIVFSGGRG